MSNPTDTVFHKIVNREIPADIVHEDDVCIVIKDIKPKARIHLLFIPKKPIVSLQDITSDDWQMLGQLLGQVPVVAKKLGVADSGYKVITNIGIDGGQEVPYLHFHFLAGEKITKSA